MGKNTIAVIIATLIVATLGLSSLGGEWVLGTFWKWKATGAQSRSVTSTVTIYVLTATTVLDAQVYVLRQVNQIEDATFVTLGEAIREPGYPIQAFGVSFQNDAEWRLNPPGWESREFIELARRRHCWIQDDRSQGGDKRSFCLRSGWRVRVLQQACNQQPRRLSRRDRRSAKDNLVLPRSRLAGEDQRYRHFSRDALHKNDNPC